MKKIIIRNNDKDNFVFINLDNLSIYCSDLINFSDFFYQLSQILRKDNELSNTIALLKKEIQILELNNNLKRTKNYIVFNKLLINGMLVSFNIFPKNISFYNYNDIENSQLKVNLDYYINKIYQNIILLNKTKEEKIYINKGKKDSNHSSQINIQLIKSIIRKIKTSKVTLRNKEIKSMSIIGRIDWLKTISNNEVPGFYQTIEQDKNVLRNNIYIKLLLAKLYLSYIILEKEEIKTLEFFFNYINIKIETNKRKRQKEIELINHYLSLIKDKKMIKLFELLFDKNIYLSSQKNIFYITNRVIDLANMWENFVKLYLNNTSNEEDKIINGNEKDSVYRTLFEKEYELKYDFIIQSKNNVGHLLNNIVDAKFKQAKKNKKGEILYDGNDIRQLFIYLEAYNNTNIISETDLYSMLIYPETQFFNLKEQEQLSLMTYNKNENNSKINNTKIFSKNLKQFKIYFKEIPIFKIRKNS